MHIPFRWNLIIVNFFADTSSDIPAVKVGHAFLDLRSRVPEFAFPRSYIPGSLGTRECGNANLLQEHGNEECENLGTLIHVLEML